MPVVRPIAKIGVGVGLLLLLQLVVSRLPMLNEAMPLRSTDLSYGALVTAAVNTAILVLLLRFGAEVRVGLQLTTSPEAGRVVQLGIWLATLAFAYRAYGGIASRLLGPRIELYQFAFVALAVIDVAAIGTVIVCHLDTLTDWTMRAAHRLQQRTSVSYFLPLHSARDVASPDMPTCAKCGASIAPAQRFCRACGTALQSL